jgi:hypothetical protein
MILIDSLTPYCCDREIQKQAIQAFDVDSMELVRTIVMKSARKSGELDSVPSSLLIERIYPIYPSLTDCINTSLLSGEFPSLFENKLPF